ANEPLGLRPASLIEAFIPAGVYVFFFRWLHKKTYIKKVYAKRFVFTPAKILMSQPLFVFIVFKYLFLMLTPTLFTLHFIYCYSQVIFGISMTSLLISILLNKPFNFSV